MASFKRLALKAAGALVATLIAAALLPAQAQTQTPLPSAQGDRLSVTVSGGEFQPTPIALPRFSTKDPAANELAGDIWTVVRDDLVNSGLFATVEGGPANESLAVQPQFAGWQQIGAQALTLGELSMEADGNIAVEFRLWDLVSQQPLKQARYRADPTGWRRVAHIIADDIYEQLTGDGRYFDSRIVFVEESGPKNRRRKRLAIMDSDGANVTYLTSPNVLVLTPRFSPVDQELTFISYQTGQPQVYLLNLRTELQQILGELPGMTFAPRFSPDGQRVILSLERSGSTDIYLMDIATKRLRQLTNSIGIDTAPSFSPDGSKVVFESDRGASQQIYVMNADGSDQQRISFGDGRYGTPVWSPRGDLIAFTKMQGGQFHIGVMRPDGTEERLLSSGFLNEGPTWAPNGRVLMFFRETRGENGLPQLYTIDVTGRNERRLVTPAGASDPAWSPLLR
ncbi:MAG: Tol-Pal system beta propeller repeat protein TolB [Neomegalonema sp.]|nr:Tol-Pal system beta propeller repeat protein TolB [Neomegalonema sp.]